MLFLFLIWLLQFVVFYRLLEVMDDDSRSEFGLATLFIQILVIVATAVCGVVWYIRG